MTEKNLVKVLLVEDEKRHLNLSRFPQEAQIKVVRNLADAVREIYGLSKSEYSKGYTNMEIKNPKAYDMLLTDMNFPIGTGKFGQNDISSLVREGAEEPAPLGWPLVLLGSQAGIKMIGMLTDSNHHQGPMAASFDVLTKNAMKLNDSRLYVWNSRVGIESGNEYFGACSESSKDEKDYSTLYKALLHPDKYKIIWSN